MFSAGTTSLLFIMGRLIASHGLVLRGGILCGRVVDDVGRRARCVGKMKIESQRAAASIGRIRKIRNWR